MEPRDSDELEILLKYGILKLLYIFLSLSLLPVLYFLKQIFTEQ